MFNKKNTFLVITLFVALILFGCDNKETIKIDKSISKEDLIDKVIKEANNLNSFTIQGNESYNLTDEDDNSIKTTLKYKAFLTYKKDLIDLEEGHIIYENAEKPLEYYIKDTNESYVKDYSTEYKYYMKYFPDEDDQVAIQSYTIIQLYFLLTSNIDDNLDKYNLTVAENNYILKNKEEEYVFNSEFHLISIKINEEQYISTIKISDINNTKIELDEDYKSNSEMLELINENNSDNIIQEKIVVE